jgi:tRNA (guanine37-N1)-methyltransferase
MQIDILSAIPELLESFFSFSILKRAKEKNLAHIILHDLRKYGLGKHKKIDNYPYGGAAGMLLSIEPIDKAIEKLSTQVRYDEVIFMSADGELLSQPLASELASKKNLLILCGHYKGVDQRVRDHLITKEISIGNYILSGGELPAAVLCDAIIRLIPGVLGNLDSALSDSYYKQQVVCDAYLDDFQKKNQLNSQSDPELCQKKVLAPPIYTRPSEYKGWKVPEILLSGNHALIKKWENEKSLELTKIKRPDLLK